MNDKELDDFFRKQSENPDIPYREEDWEKLRKKLDAAPKINGSKRGNKGWWIGLLMLALLVGIGLGWKYWGDKNQHPATPPSQSTISASSFGNAEIPEDVQKSEETEHPKAEDSTAEQVVPPTLRSNRSLSSAEDTEQADMSSTSVKWSGSASGSYHLTPAPSPVKRALVVPIESNLRAVKFLPLEFPTDGKGKFEVAPLPEERKLGLYPTEAEARKKKFSGSRFSSTLTLAPDVSALKIKDIQGLGNSVGLNLEYFFHPNISINAGAMYVFKTYQAGEGYSTGYVPAPSHVNGSCWVLDLPLNLRYYAFHQRLSRWYMTVGLSSYLMLKEKYDLEYKSYNYGGNAYGNSLEVQNKNKHYLNIVNLGIGYERVLTDRLSLQVEPYLKLPFSGIGEGDITLKSAGAFVGLKYGW
jgi:outer membrane protein W